MVPFLFSVNRFERIEMCNLLFKSECHSRYELPLFRVASFDSSSNLTPRLSLSLANRFYYARSTSECTHIVCAVCEGSTDLRALLARASNSATQVAATSTAFADALDHELASLSSHKQHCPASCAASSSNVPIGMPTKAMNIAHIHNEGRYNARANAQFIETARPYGLKMCSCLVYWKIGSHFKILKLSKLLIRFYDFLF